MRRFIDMFAAIASIACIAATPLRAETLPIEGAYPAGSDLLSALNSLAFAPFTGQQGQPLAIELEQRLRDVSVQGRPYFTIVPFQSKSGSDGTVGGSAWSGIETRREDVKRQECVASDADGKCEKRRSVVIACTRRIITLNYTLTVEGRERDRMLGVTDTAVDSALLCPDTGSAPPIDIVAGQMVAGVAREIRLQFAPVETREDVRVKESTGGLQNNAKKKFKDAIRLTKQNVAAACSVWGEVDQLVPDHSPTLFNLGLCAESRRDYNAAEALYHRVEGLNRSELYVTEAIERLNRRRIAERQIATHVRAPFDRSGSP